MKKRYIEKLKQKSGIAIMSVLLFFMVMMVMVGALSISSMGNARLSNTNSDNAAAYYAAEAGINFVVSDFRRVIGVEEGDLTQAEFVAAINTFITNHGNTRLNHSLNNGSESYSLISFENPIHNTSSQTFQFTVVSEGVVKDQSRTLKTFVDLDYSLGAGNRQGFAVKHALLVKNTLRTGMNFTIKVSDDTLEANPSALPWIATDSISPNSILLGQQNNLNNISIVDINGFVEVRNNAPNRVANVPSGKIKNTLNINEFTPLSFDNIRLEAQNVIISTNNRIPSVTGFTSGSNIIPTASGTYEIPSGSYYVPEIDFKSNFNIIINANGPVFIVTDKMLMLGNINFTGTGEVRFYVRRNMNSVNTFVLKHNVQSSNGNKLINVGREISPHLFQVYVDETNIPMTITPANNNNIYGSFMFHNANLNFSNNVSFGGYLMTGGQTVNLSNGSEVYTALYYAPNANVSVGNATVRGAIIANNVTLANNAIIEYEPAFLTNFPFAVESPIVDTTRTEGVHSIVFRIHRTTEQ